MNIVVILASVLLNCFAQLFMKRGMEQFKELNLASLISSCGDMITNIWLWLAMFSYGISIFLWMYVLSKCDVSYAYPFLSIGYVVAAILGYYLFNESLTVYRISGIAVICLGVFLISRS